MIRLINIWTHHLSSISCHVIHWSKHDIMKNVDRVNEALFSFTSFSIDRSLFNLRPVSVIPTRHDGRFTFHLSFDIVRRIGHFVTGLHFSDVLNHRSDLVCFAFTVVVFSWLLFICILQHGTICRFGRSLAIARFLNRSVPSPVHHLESPATVSCHTLFVSRFDSCDVAVQIWKWHVSPFCLPGRTRTTPRENDASYHVWCTRARSTSPVIRWS